MTQKTISSRKYHRLLKWLRDEREAQSLSVRDLAVVMKRSHSYIGKVETAERRLDVLEYVEYCRALDIDPREGLALLE